MTWGKEVVNQHKAGRNGHANGHAPTFKPAPTTARFRAFYDLSRGKFFHERGDGEWIQLEEKALSRILRSTGFSKSLLHDNTLSYLENELMRLQLDNGVCYAGELAGYPAGETWICGQRCLVTRGPTIPEPKEGKWPVLGKFFAELFGDFRAEFFAWLKCARQALRAGPPWRPGQILVLAGPAGCGKNLCQGIITEILGGRVAKPYRYMVGETSFNKELLSAEHLVIQDEAPLADFKARRIFGARIKDFVVNEVQSYHPKGRDAISLTPFWRLSVSLNEEPENLQILPPLDESLRDKLMLFRCGMTTLPFDGADPKSRAEFRDKITREIPGFLHWLGRWRIPDRLKDQRYGCAAHLDPHLVAEIDSLSPEMRLWHLLLSSGILPAMTGAWFGSAAELESQLRDKYPREADRLLTYPTACGVFLQRLSRHPHLKDCVQHERGPDNTRAWTICRPTSANGRATH